MDMIILAGGLGTRLREVVPQLPKPMANVNGKPFLQYIIDYYLPQNIEHIYLSTGYKSDVIEEFVSNNYPTKVSCIEEEIPLGTGGAIKNIIEKACIKENESFIVVNGDTFLDIRLEELRFFYYNNNYDIALTLFKMKEFSRYGSVELENSQITNFYEKKYCKEGFINAGVYMINSSTFNKFNLPNSFSFEEFLLKNIPNLNIGGCITSSKYFIDIGIPTDYAKVQKDFKEMF